MQRYHWSAHRKRDSKTLCRTHLRACSELSGREFFKNQSLEKDKSFIFSKDANSSCNCRQSLEVKTKALCPSIFNTVMCQLPLFAPTPIHVLVMPLSSCTRSLLTRLACLHMQYGPSNGSKSRVGSKFCCKCTLQSRKHVTWEYSTQSPQPIHCRMRGAQLPRFILFRWATVLNQIRPGT